MPVADVAPWYATAFGRLWLRLHPHRDDAEAARHAAFIVHALGLKAGARVLDVGCGGGRYCRALAARGLKVTGVDLSAEMLEAARAQSPNLPGSPLYLRADARALPFVAQFEGAVSLFTSLGYFDARRDDLDLLRGVARALVPGGAFLLDYLNPAHVRATLVAEEEGAVDGHHVHVRRSCEESAAGPVVVKRVTVRHAGAKRIESEFFERVRLYEPAEIDALLAEAGLVPEGERWGSLEGARFEPASERQVRLARKAARR
ncbi:MAG: class I SAM-dependent methyltransferase [Planctomycetia bacterium]